MPSGRSLKMKDLERATGVGRETIRFYIREGLLPEPKRPGRNVAWYDPAHVERIRLIKELQQKRFLPLHVIRAMVGNGARPSRDEVHALLELDGKIFPVVARAPAEGEKLGQVARRTGLSAVEMRRLAEVGAIEIVTRDGTPWLEETAVRLVELWAKMRKAGYTESLGFRPENLRLYVDFVRWLAREELQLFTHGITGRVSTEKSARMAEDGITHLNQIIALLRKSTLLRYIAQGNVPDPQRHRRSRPALRPPRRQPHAAAPDAN